ncbi:MAG: hypothetical protein ACK5UT_17915 [Acidobacteriota bacterium]
MKLGTALFCVTLASGPANAQCGRCGPDGGGNPPGPPRTSYRPQLPLILPDGLGTIQAQLRIDRLSVDGGQTRYFAVSELLLDAVMDRPVRLTEIALRRPQAQLTFGITAANPLVLPAGRSTVVLRGSTLETTAGEAGWTLFVQTEERAEGYSLNPAFTLEGAEAIALAHLTPPRDLEGAAVAIRATYLRRTPGSPITAAELQYQVRYRAGNSAAVIAGLALRSVAAFGPTVIEAPIPNTVATAGTSGTITFRQILDPTNAAAMAGLEAMLQNPSSLYVQLRTAAGNGGALLRTPESLTYEVRGERILTSSTPETASTGGLVTIHTLRNEAGTVLAGLANISLAARGFTRPGAVLTGFTVEGPPARVLPLQPDLNDTRFNATGDTVVYQDYPLLGDDPLLAYLLKPGLFRARLNTTIDAQGVMTLTAVGPQPELSPPTMAITQVLPAVSTPGSIVSLFGRSLPAQAAQAAVSLEGLPVEILYASPTQINLRLPPGLTTTTAPAPSPSLLRTLLLVNLPEATTARATLTVDVVEPFIFNRPSIFFAGSRRPVLPESPAGAGDLLDIYCTGITLRPDIRYTVRIGDQAAASVVPQPSGPGAWVLRATVPTGLAPGNQPVSVFATFDNGRVFPRAAQAVALAVR